MNSILNIAPYLMMQELYEPIPSSQGSTGSKQTMCSALSIPPHSLVAFGLFLRLPGYAEVLLREKRKAQCLLRLVLGVTDDGEGGKLCHQIRILIWPYCRMTDNIILYG